MNKETATLLENHFDLAFAGPKGVQKLRELILTFAMQGKLVPQDPTDRPASELLKDVETEKQRLIEQEGLRTDADEHVDESEEYLGRPDGWTYCRLGNLAKFIDYRGKTPKKVDSGIPLITAKNVRFGYINREPYEYITEFEYESWMTRGFPKIGDLLFTTEAPLGNIAIIEIQEQFALAQRVICLQLHKPEIAYFLKWLAMSKSFQTKLIDNATGMTAKGIKSARFREIPVPIPPIAEQHRIVAKIEQLMARCDELETLGTDRTQKRTNVHRAAIDRLLTAKADRDFNTAWNFITQHFGELYSVKENVTELRKTILQLAVMGKLVPQDPTDEPASELLKAIEIEKQRLVKEGEIKDSQSLPELQSENIPYSVPKEWEWVRFEDIVVISSGVTKGRKLNGKEMVSLPYLRVANVQRSYLDLKVIKEIEIAKDEISRFELKERDLLITEGGDWDKVGRTAIWNSEILNCIHQNHVFKARCLLIRQNEKWLEKYLNSNVARDYFGNASKQTTNLASINKTQLRGCPIPIPPLAEQHRIVAKIDRLMELCDRLDEQIEAAKTKQTELLNALMAEV